jgi:ribosomal protein S18 acetylase RimI-like enzyme
VGNVNTSEIQKLTSLSNDQLKLASEVLSNAFQEDPVFSKLIPNDKERHKTLFKIFKFQIKYCLKHGVVLSTSNLKGISLWLPPKNAFISIWKSIKSGSLSLIFKIKWKNLHILRKNDDFCKDLHKKLIPTPHWYLSTIGIDPKHQGKGIGGRMISFMINRIAKDHKTIFLETNSERNVKIYKYFGFRNLHKVLTPGTNIYHWSMIRCPIKKN